MKVTIRLSSSSIGGKDTTTSSYSLTIPDNSTVNDLKAAALVALPSDLINTFSTPVAVSSVGGDNSSSTAKHLSLSNFSLIFSGKKLELHRLLSSYSITENSVVYLINNSQNINPNESPVLPSVELANSTIEGGKEINNEVITTEDGNTEEIHPQITTTTTTKKRRKSSNKRSKCSFPRCSNQPLKIVGDCQHCEGHYCSKHRLLESHCCSGLQNCKNQLFEQNATKLHREQTVASKV
ncbi:hypothetical protein PACTADRAFT_49298 [Pachysolen tannophilus NRRL Y-2460]|uniref:Uncharacterized protein n=1 Tax=Pachysolen tannophilus NRRL Y-2460 TaxID=669874 RepID=A0A1E4TVR2_PACTA|nr:hypothetical protein PACTADRAFT_49298 [Pachysolen tannophilus NRRL Y-2460]